METWEWIVIAVVALILIGVVAWAVSQRRTARLRRQFGGEYDRTVDRSENRRQAEVDLRDRTRQRNRLEIRPLSPAARDRYVTSWQSIQQRFVDQPVQAVADADALLTTVMSERGYPDDFEQHVAVVSVDHPTVVENYRMAHAVRDRAFAGETTTEDLREALVHYRSLFEELLETDDADVVDADDADVVDAEAVDADEERPARGARS
jgi:hypothetical protein